MDLASMAKHRVVAWATLVILAGGVAAQPSPKPSTGLLDRFRDANDIIFLPNPGEGRLDEVDNVIVPMKRWNSLQEELTRLRRREPASITRIELRGRVNEERVEFDGAVEIRVDSAPAIVPIGLQEANCTSIRMRDGPLPIAQKESGKPYVITIPKQGLHSIELSFFVTADPPPGERKLSLTLPNAAVKSVTLTSEEEFVDVRGATNQSMPLSPDKKSARVLLRNDESLKVGWLTTKDRRELAAWAGVVTGVLRYRLGETRIAPAPAPSPMGPPPGVPPPALEQLTFTEAELRLEATSATFELNFFLPAGEKINSVRCEQDGAPFGLEFSTTPQADRTALRVRFAKPLSRTAQLLITSERPRPAAQSTIEIGRLELDGARAQTGVIHVYTAADISAEFTPGDGLRRVPARPDSAGPRAPPVRAYEYQSQPARLLVDVKSAQPVLSAQVATELFVTAENIELFSRLRVKIERARAGRLELRIPRELANPRIGPEESIEVLGRRDDVRGGVAELDVSLSDAALGDVEIEIRGEMPINAGQVIAVRLPSLGGKAENSGIVSVRSAANVQLAIDAKGTKNLQRQPLAPGTGEESAPQWLFRSARGATELALTATRLPRKTEATIESQFQQSAREISVTDVVTFRAQHEPLTQITLAVPDAALDVDIRGDNLLAERRRAPGQITIPLASPQDRCEARVRYRFPLPATGPNAEEFVLPLVLPVGAAITSQTGNLFLEPGIWATPSSPWEISSTPRKNDAHFADDAALPLRSTAPVDRLGLTFQTTATLAKFIAPKVVVDVHVGAAGQRAGRKRLLITRHRSEIAKFQFPAGCRPTEIFVDGEPVRQPVFREGIINVRLPKGDAPCTVELRYEFTDTVALSALNRLLLEAPRLLDQAAIGETLWLVKSNGDRLYFWPSGDAIAQTRWSFWGFLTRPRSTVDPQAADWIREGNEVRWTPLEQETTGGVWAFLSDGDMDSLGLWSMRQSFWILIGSGTVLVAGRALTQARTTVLWPTALGGGISIIAIASVAPTFCLWVWLGCQWGVYLIMATSLGIWLARGRPRPLWNASANREPLPRSSAGRSAEELGFSAVNFLAKLQTEHRGGNVSVVGSTMELGK